jgi:transposase-like protein
VQGISTRTVDDLAKPLGMSGVSKSQVSGCAANCTSGSKPSWSQIEGDWPYLGWTRPT